MLMLMRCVATALRCILPSFCPGLCWVCVCALCSVLCELFSACLLVALGWIWRYSTWGWLYGRTDWTHGTGLDLGVLFLLCVVYFVRHNVLLVCNQELPDMAGPQNLCFFYLLSGGGVTALLWRSNVSVDGHCEDKEL